MKTLLKLVGVGILFYLTFKVGIIVAQNSNPAFAFSFGIFMLMVGYYIFRGPDQNKD